jgi:uncharacterized lipoprotein
MLSLNGNAVRRLAICSLSCVFLASCNWFKVRPEFEGVEIAKPLVVPADLSKPSSNGAMLIPSKSLIGANAKSPDQISSFLVSDSVDNVWKRVGIMLPTIDQVTVLNKVDSIKSYEVRYGPDVFLISVQANGSQTQIAALGADGKVINNKSSSQLMSQLKSLVK